MYFFNDCQTTHYLKTELSSQFFYRKVLGRRFKLYALFCILLLVKHPYMIYFNHQMTLNLTDF